MVDRPSVLTMPSGPDVQSSAPAELAGYDRLVTIESRAPTPVACPLPSERWVAGMAGDPPIAAFPSPLAETLSGQLEATLSLISGYSQTLLELDLGDEERRRYASAMLVETENVTQLTRAILAITADRPVPASAPVLRQLPAPRSLGRPAIAASMELAADAAIVPRRSWASIRGIPGLLAAGAALGGLVVTQVTGLGMPTYAAVGVVIAVGYLAVASRLRV